MRNFSAEFPILSSYGRVISANSDTTIYVDNKKIKEIATVINGIDNRNLFLRGKAGVGKTATIYALAKYLASNACPSRLRNMVIAQIDLNRLKSVGNSNNSSVIEKSIKDIWDEASRNKNVILFIDEGHRIATGGADSIGNILKPLVTSGEVPVILATTEDEFRRYIDPDLALKRRFHPIQINEPKGEILFSILKNKGADYAQKLGVKISEETYKKTVELADRYIHETANPDKSIRLLERACSAASRDGKADVSLDDLVEGLEIISNVQLLKHDASVSPESISSELCKKIKGQEIAVEKVGEFISQHLKGLFVSDIPASLALLGPGGCGKTELAREIASRLGYKKSANEIIEIKMSSLRGGYNAMTLLLGGKIDELRTVAGSLTEPVRKNPNRFIIIDEIEDMPKEIISVFEQMMTSGIVRDGVGNDVNFKSTVVTFTGNIGKAKQFGFASDASASEMARKQEEEMFHKLREKFSGDFCSNISVFVPLAELSKPVVMDIIRSACDAEMTDDACEHIASLCEYKKYGAREVSNKLNSIMRKLGQPSSIVLEDGVLCAARKEGIAPADFSNNLS